jgi:hypothetical protein
VEQRGGVAAVATAVLLPHVLATRDPDRNLDHHVVGEVSRLLGALPATLTTDPASSTTQLALA